MKTAQWYLDSIRIRTGVWLSEWGEKLQNESLIYNQYVYLNYDRLAGHTAPAVAESLLKANVRPESTVDFGAGTGRYVEEFRRRGAKATGFEYSKKARKFARKQYAIDLLPFDLTSKKLSPVQTDLAMSLEVAEHIPHDLAIRLVQLCTASAPTVLFSAARPGQPGQGHINCRPISEWQALFVENGFRLDENATKTIRDALSEKLIGGRWLIENVGLYRKEDKPRGATRD
jgi:SAM-dependent methyltransferase